MANASRTQRRKEERERRKATKQIPPEVRARLAQIQSGTPAPAAPSPPPQAENGDKSPPKEEPAAPPTPPPPSPEFDLPPGIPADLPPEIAAAVSRAQEAMGGGEEGGTRTAPGKAASPAKARQKRFLDLEKELAVLLTLPGPFFEGAGDSYCASHFMLQGPLLANRLVSYAETNPATADLLERIVKAGGFAVVAMAIFSYALPPMLHHGLPAPEGLRKMYNVPSHAPKNPHPEEPPHEG